MEIDINEVKNYLVTVLNKKLIDSNESDNRKYGYRFLALKYWPEEFDGTPKHVHHIDGNRRNNVVSNLVVLTPSEHQKLHNLFYPKTIAARKVIADSHRGKPSPMKGRKLSEESKKKLSIAHKGKPSPRKGSTHKQESIDKMSKAFKNKHWYYDKELKKRVWY